MRPPITPEDRVRISELRATVTELRSQSNLIRRQAAAAEEQICQLEYPTNRYGEDGNWSGRAFLPAFFWGLIVYAVLTLADVLIPSAPNSALRDALVLVPLCPAIAVGLVLYHRRKLRWFWDHKIQRSAAAS
jgi:hypothetical protein